MAVCGDAELMGSGPFRQRHEYGYSLFCLQPTKPVLTIVPHW